MGRARARKDSKTALKTFQKESEAPSNGPKEELRAVSIGTKTSICSLNDY